MRQSQKRKKPTILSIGFNAYINQMIAETVSGEYDVRVIGSGQEAINQLGELKASAAIVDIRTPLIGQYGFNLAEGEDLFNQITASRMPIIVLTSIGDEGLEAKLARNAHAIVSKPRNNAASEEHFNALLAMHLRSAIQMQTQQAQISKLETLALIDPMTKLYRKEEFERRIAAAFNFTKRQYEKAGPEIIERSETASFLSIIYFDLDGLGTINNDDDNGHYVADKVIKHVGAIFRQIRNYEIAGKIGGDEFAVMLHAPLGDSFRVGTRICREIDSYDFQKHIKPDKPFSMGISAGIATYPYPHNVKNSVELTTIAERLMKKAKVDKKEGRAKGIVFYSQLPNGTFYQLDF